MQKKLINDYGLLSRGAIAFGNAYCKENLWFGSALSMAYHAEQTLANYPRVILHESAINELNNINKMLKDLYLKRDIDGTSYCNYLNPILTPKYDHEKILNFADIQIQELKDNHKACQK